MAQITVYLPDDLAEQVRSTPGINISGTCQAALRRELGQHSVARRRPLPVPGHRRRGTTNRKAGRQRSP
jgi:hypothetical protein